MIYSKFNPEDVVVGRTNRVASGFWPDGTTNFDQSDLRDNYFSLTQSSSPSVSYGSSLYDVRKTMYYLDVFPGDLYKTNEDPYFSVTYGHIAGDQGSGSFAQETASIKTSPTKTIYSQYKNLLLGSSDPDGEFSFKTGSGADTVNADDVFILSFSSYKMKDRIDEGIFEISFYGTNGVFTFKDDSIYQSSVKAVYNIITGSTDTTITSPSLSYQGLGLLYPSNGVVVFNAKKLNDLVGLSTISESLGAPCNYNSGCRVDDPLGNKSNFYALFWSMQNAGIMASKQIKVRKSEYVPSRHYFIRVKNREFNYSNNPTYVYDGNDGIHPKGTIRNDDFISNPKTYLTTVGLYNENNELIAVAKLSRPVVKSFDDEVHLKVKFDF